MFTEVSLLDSNFRRWMWQWWAGLRPVLMWTSWKTTGVSYSIEFMREESNIPTFLSWRRPFTSLKPSRHSSSPPIMYIIAQSSPRSCKSSRGQISTIKMWSKCRKATFEVFLYLLNRLDDTSPDSDRWSPTMQLLMNLLGIRNFFASAYTRTSCSYYFISITVIVYHYARNRPGTPSASGRLLKILKPRTHGQR